MVQILITVFIIEDTRFIVDKLLGIARHSCSDWLYSDCIYNCVLVTGLHVDALSHVYACAPFLGVLTSLGFGDVGVLRVEHRCTCLVVVYGIVCTAPITAH